jgi:hypothetical protein
MVDMEKNICAMIWNRRRIIGKNVVKTLTETKNRQERTGISGMQTESDNRRPDESARPPAGT